MLVYCDREGDDYQAAMRRHRDKLLTASDWTQVADTNLSDNDRMAWVVYRQQLRDFPSTWTPGPTADFPEPPA